MQGQFAHGLARTGRGEYDDGLRAFNEGLALAEKLGSGFFHNRFLNSLGWIHAECGDLERAIQLNERGLGLSRERGDPETIANCELNLGDVFGAKGDIALSRELFAGVHDLVRRPSTSDWMKWRYSQHLFAGLGEAWLASDDRAMAEDFCDLCLDLATRTELEEIPRARLAPEGSKSPSRDCTGKKLRKRCAER